MSEESPLPLVEDAGPKGSKSSTTTATAKQSSPSLAELRKNLQSGLRQYPDFPKPGILFEDILPLFSSIDLHRDLVDAFEVQIGELFGADKKPDVIVGLDARGFLFGPSIALRIGAGFVPVRKEGKLPGKIETAKYEKEYGTDVFAMQSDAIEAGQKVLVVDDLIATGGSAAAAGALVRKCGGDLLGFIFIIELGFLKGRDKLDAPVYTLLESQSC